MSTQSIPEDAIRSFLNKVQYIGEDLPQGRQFTVKLDEALLKAVEYPIELLGALRRLCGEYQVATLGSYDKHYTFRKI